MIAYSLFQSVSSTLTACDWEEPSLDINNFIAALHNRISFIMRLQK